MQVLCEPGWVGRGRRWPSLPVPPSGPVASPGPLASPFIAPFPAPRLCSACGWDHGHRGVSVLLPEQSWLNTKKSRLLCLFSGPLVTGLRSANCSQGKAARRNAILVWTTLVVQESPGRLGAPVTLSWCSGTFCSLSPPHPSKQTCFSPGLVPSRCPPQDERPRSQSMEVPRPRVGWVALYTSSSVMQMQVFVVGFRPPTKDLKSCSVRSEKSYSTDTHIFFFLVP